MRWLLVSMLFAGCYQPKDAVQCTLSCTGDDCPAGFACDTAAMQCAPLGNTCMQAVDAAIDGDGSTPDSPIDGATACPLTYNKPSTNSPSRYRVDASPATWNAALLDCLADVPTNSSVHTHLVVLSDDVERGNVGSFTGGGAYWIGLSDIALEGTYQAVTNENPSFPPASGSPWATGEPKAGPGNNCVSYQNAAGALLEVAICSTTRRYICECDAFVDTPANYTVPN